MIIMTASTPVNRELKFPVLVKKTKSTIVNNRNNIEINKIDFLIFLLLRI